METRVQKYKTYRASLIKEGSQTVVDLSNKHETTTLPRDEVMKETNDNANTTYFKVEKRNHRLFWFIVISGIIIVIGGIVLLCIFAFK